mgnify:CR=1 FL=1
MIQVGTHTLNTVVMEAGLLVRSTSGVNPCKLEQQIATAVCDVGGGFCGDSERATHFPSFTGSSLGFSVQIL